MSKVNAKLLAEICLVMSVTLVPLGLAYGNTLYVGPTGDYATVRSAIVAAQDNDTIVITTNVHMEAGIVVTNRVNLTIMGNTLNPADTVVQASNAYDIATDRVFLTKTNCTFRNLTIRYGKIGGSGGGLYSDSKAPIVVSNCVVTQNRTTGAFGGGGIACADGIALALVVYDSTISDNMAGGTGGGIILGVNNTCGAKIYSSTISGNVATNYGGGVVANAGPVEIYNSTVYSNTSWSATTGGGGLSIRSGGHVIRNCTITRNACPNGLGGGVASILAAAGSITLDGTILAGNTALTGPDFYNGNGETVTERFNLIGVTNGSSQANGRLIYGKPNANGSWIGKADDPMDPKILALANNGGLTLTCALSFDSQAVNSGTNASGYIYDQRGGGYPRLIGASVDIGAYEAPLMIAYSKAALYEQMPQNDGSINNSDPVTISLINETFTGVNNDVFDASKVQVSGLPNGLTAVITRVTSASLSLMLAGNATEHEAVNNVTNFGLAFTDSAFTGGSAPGVVNSSVSNLTVSFANAGDQNSGMLYYSGTSFNESASFNDGRIDNATPISITVSNDSFTGSPGDNFVTGDIPKVVVSNLPNGLTAVVSRASSNLKLTVTLTGNAAMHNSIDNVTNLTFAFSNDAFGGANAAAVAGASTAVSIAFINPALTWLGSGFVEKIPDNNGSMDSVPIVSVSLKGDTFTVTNGSMAGKFTHNAPSGLSVVVATTNSTSAIVSLTGAADMHANANDMTNLTVTFNDTAFSMGGAAAVSGYDKTNLVIDFKDPAREWYVSQTNSGDSASYDGTVTNPYATITKAIKMSAAGDTIILQPGTLTEAGIIVTNAFLTLLGKSGNPADTIVQASNAYDVASTRVFEVRTNCVFRNMTIRYGRQTASYGAGMYVNMTGGFVLISNCVVTLNRNTSAFGGGGIYFSGPTVVMCDSTLSGNSTTNAPGGGLYAQTGNLRMTNCTISGNSSGTSGGGIYAAGFSPTLVNCTVYSNTANGASGQGGGVYISGGTATGNVVNCTITGNAAMGLAGGGGGLANGPSNIRIISTIIAGNFVVASTNGPDYFSFSSSSSRLYERNNLIGCTNGPVAPANAFAYGLTNASGSYVGTFEAQVNPKLLPLANNKGATWTCALQSDSLAIDHGTNTLGLLYDQRGEGYKRVVGEQADIGAFEFGAGSVAGSFLMLH